MKIFLYSNSIIMVDMWSEYLKNYDVAIIDDEDMFLNCKDSLVLFNIESSPSCSKWIKTLLKSNNKILLLQNVPDFMQGKRFLQQGIHGYGNSMMSSAFLNSGVISIIEGFIWIHPKFTQNLIENIPQNNDKLQYIENLTQKEKKVALLVCDGLSNIEISKHLNVSINTVKSHIKKIYEKLNVNDRLALVLLLK